MPTRRRLAKYVLSESGSAIRDFCEDEAVVVADALGRQAARRLFDRAATAGVALGRLPFVGSRLEKALRTRRRRRRRCSYRGRRAEFSLRVAARGARRRGASIETATTSSTPWT